MQRTSSSSSRLLEDCCVLNINQQPQPRPSPRRRMEGTRGFLMHVVHQSSKKRELLQSRLAGMWIHTIPIVVLLCFFVLWWFSYPVDVVIKDHEIIAIRRIETQKLGNDTHTDPTILAASSSPNVSVPLNFTSNNESEEPRGNKSS